MVGTYAAVICTLHYCSKDWGTNVLPTCPPPRSKLILSPASILIYEDTMCAVFDDPQLRTYSTATMIPPFWLLQADYALTVLGIQYDNSTVFFYMIPQMLWQFQLRWCPSTNPQIPFDKDSADTLWWFHRYPLTIPRIPSPMLRINCGLPMRWIHGFHKVSCVMYRICMCTRSVRESLTCAPCNVYVCIDICW